MDKSVGSRVGNFIENVKSIDLKYALLIYIPLLALCAVNIRPDCDCYFIIENGKYIIENGSFPYEDWVTIHSGLHFVMQQWTFSCVVYLIYSNFGFLGLYVLMSVLCFTLYMLIFKICLIKSNNEHLMSFLATFIAAMTISYISGTIRPTVLSLTFVSLTILVLEKSKANSNLLFLLPLLSLAQSNTHSTFWIAVIGTMCVYYMFDFKNVRLLVAIILSMLIGFMNPYGYEAIFQPLFTIGYNEYNAVAELQPLSGMTLIMFMSIPLVLTIYLGVKRGLRKDQRYLMFLFVVTLLASLLAMRSTSFFVLIFAFMLSSFYFSNERSGGKKPDSKHFVVIVGISLLIAMVTVSSTITCFNGLEVTKQSSKINISEMCIDYFDTVDESELDGATLMTDEVQTGQVLHHEYGLTPYIDGRLETYIDSLNKKENIFGEFLRVKKGLIYLQDFLDKYNNFDYIVTTHDSCIEASARHLDDYEVVFDSEHQNGYVIFKHKDNS